MPLKAGVGRPSEVAVVPMPGSRAYFRAVGHISGHISGQPGIPGSRTAGHTGQPGIVPGSRTAGHTGQPGIVPGSRTAGHTGQPGIFPGSRTYFRATGQSGIVPGSRAYRAAGHTGQSGIVRAVFQASFRAAAQPGRCSGQPHIFYPSCVHIFCGRFNVSIRIDNRTPLRTVFVYYFISGRPTLLCSGRRWRGLYAGRDLLAWWRTSARAGLWKSPAVPLKAGVGPHLTRKAHTKQKNQYKCLYK